MTSAGTAQQVTGLGFTKVYAFKGGWREWSEAEFPTGSE